MDRFKQIETFVSVALRGSLTAAAAAEGVSSAVISRRLDALEERLGIKLTVRTTRRVTLTFEGSAHLEECQRILRELADAEAAVSMGSLKARGHLHISAPAGFGRRYVAPLVMRFLEENPDIKVSLDLTDRIVDLIFENVDCAIRLGELADSSLISVRLSEMRRVIVASPAYIERHGAPITPADLAKHNCLSLGQQRGWTLRVAGVVEVVKVNGVLECNDGAVLHDWTLAGKGLAWRSLWEVGGDIAAGRLVTLLDDFAAPPVGIHALMPQRRHLPLRVRLFIDLLKQAYGELDWAKE
ncbi:MAG: LysR family transcriptional regulator [Betaproteobacteria bacterium]|nr:LysR family transcriptional regulator [Betaproteobacteria bacterium]